MRAQVGLVSVVVAHLVAAGCYEPQLRDCTISCSGENECVSGQSCRDGWCVSPATLTCIDGIAIAVDAAPMPDTQDVAPDATDLCPLGCSNGTCVDGVCVIDCSAPGSCSTDIKCPANLPCRVVCGDYACDHKILCQDAASCTVECTGQGACGDEIQCMDVPCTVTCSGTASCAKRTRCPDSCECNVTCSGLGSCAEASECPMSTCRIGNGCSSVPTGCDTCTP